MERLDKKRSEFKVVLDGIKLTEEQERSISAEIQRVVASHLAELDFEGDARAGILQFGGFNGTHGGEWMLVRADMREELQRVLQRGG